jgi:hypothetical protein
MAEGDSMAEAGSMAEGHFMVVPASVAAPGSVAGQGGVPVGADRAGGVRVGVRTGTGREFTSLRRLSTPLPG